MDMRLQERGENWRLAYKSLLLMEYMAKNGPLVRLPFLRARRGRGPRALSRSPLLATHRPQNNNNNNNNTNTTATNQNNQPPNTTDSASPTPSRAGTAARSSGCASASSTPTRPGATTASTCGSARARCSSS